MPYRARGRAARRLVALAAGLLALLGSLPAPHAARGQQPAATLRPFPVAIAPGNQHRPAAYGDFVVWLDEMYERPMIRANDLRSGAEIPLSRDGALPTGAPAMSGTTVVWADRVGETSTTTWPDPHIFAHDLRTHRDFVVSPVGGRQAEPRIDGSLVVWTDYRGDPEKGDIYAYDLSTRRDFPVIVHPAHQAQPAVWGQTVVWQDWRSAEAQIFAADLTTGETWALTAQPGRYERPLISGGWVVWQDTTSGTPTIGVYDLHLRALLPSVAGRQPLALDGDLLVLESADGTTLALRDLGTTETRTLAAIPAGAPEIWASLGGGTVAWTDYRNSELHWRVGNTRLTNQDIFAARLNPSPRPAGPRPNVPYRASSPEYAMNLFVWNAPAVTATHLRRLTEAGFTWQKTRVPWAEVEWRKDEFNWNETDRIVQASNNAGVKVIVRVDVTPLWARPDSNPHGPPLRFQDYGDFLYALVNRYKTGSTIGRVHAVEVWNEPNLHKEWGDQPVNRQQAADYVRLLRAAYEGVKRADPSTMVISGSLSPTGWNDDTARPDDVYLHWMYEAGAASWFDALGLHGAGYGSAPETMPMTVERYPHPSFYFRRAEQLRDIMVQHGDADKQIWMMEFGWTTDPVNPSYAWYRVSEEEKGDYLVRAYRLAREQWAPWIGVMALWTMPDPRWTPRQEEYWWAILDPDGTERPSYQRLLEARENGQLPRP